jgi:hypothetical protein
MRRRILDYYTKNFDINDKKKLYSMIDVDGMKDFNSIVRNYLLDPKKYDHYKSIVVHGLGTQEDIETLFNLYRLKFDSMNVICGRNNTCDLFSDPLDVTLSLKERDTLIALLPEEEINMILGTESFFKYNPPVQ